ncbi:MAG: orotidine-5'-phosphate decarboxylase [Alphaproteobacteria bacterium]|nr:orotidine-5'-phosphate decarboxylase [Alphaproteobacteria bacterium]
MAVPPDVRERLILALDLPSVGQAESLIARLGDTVSFYKIGLQLQYAGGLGLAERLLAEGRNVFLDCKFSDIPETVAGAVASVARLAPQFLTVHADRPTVAAAVRARGAAAMKILAVTVLTSLDDADLAHLGSSLKVPELVERRARDAFALGADGVVASPREAAALRAIAGPGRLIVTPGIRSTAAARHDQKRVATAAEAIAAGADYLVVGREITQAADPATAAANLQAEIREAFARR